MNVTQLKQPHKKNQIQKSKTTIYMYNVNKSKMNEI